MFEALHFKVPQFGWTAERPPDYKIKLRLADFKSHGQGKQSRDYVISDQFVAKVAAKIIRQTPEDAGFVEVTNVQELLGSPRKIKAFQDALILKLACYFRKNKSPLLQSGNPFKVVKESPFHKIRMGVLGYLDHPFKRHSDGTIANSFLHWDWWDWPLLAFYYRPFTNIRGGTPRVFDAWQWACDQQKELKDLIGNYRPENVDKEYGYIYQRGLEPKTPFPLEIEEKYAIPLETDGNSIVVVNNTYEAGIAHGPLKSEKIDSNRDADRLLYHTSLATWVQRE